MEKGDSVIITTKYRGVYHGILENLDRDREQVVLTAANMVRRWGTKNGVDQLAKTGPTESSIIADMALEVLLPGITSVVVCTTQATKKWEKYKK